MNPYPPLTSAECASLDRARCPDCSAPLETGIRFPQKPDQVTVKCTGKYCGSMFDVMPRKERISRPHPDLPPPQPPDYQVENSQAAAFEKYCADHPEFNQGKTRTADEARIAPPPGTATEPTP